LAQHIFDGEETGEEANEKNSWFSVSIDFNGIVCCARARNIARHVFSEPFITRGLKYETNRKGEESVIHIVISSLSMHRIYFWVLFGSKPEFTHQ